MFRNSLFRTSVERGLDDDIFSYVDDIIRMNGLSTLKTDSIGYFPPTSVYENEEEYTIVIDLPGVNKEDVSIGIKDGKLTISGKRNTLDNYGKEIYNFNRHFGSFRKDFNISEKHLDVSSIDFSLNDGILIGKIGKKKEEKAQLEIKVK